MEVFTRSSFKVSRQEIRSLQLKSNPLAAYLIVNIYLPCMVKHNVLVHCRTLFER